MLLRVLGVLWLLALAVPAVAQWQPLDGGSGGIVAPAPNQPSADPQPGVPGGDIQSWGTAPAAPPTSSVPPTSSPPASMPAVSPPAAPPPAATPGPAAIEIRYSGQAAQDPRKASMRLILEGNTATAEVSMQSICAQNVRVGGADIRLTGTLSGPWEARGSSISGTWTGVDHHCGADDPNQGQFTFFLKDSTYGGPVLHLRIDGKNGRYGWNFTPKNKVFADGTGGGGGGGGGGTPAFVALASGFSSAIGAPGQGYRTGAAAPALRSPAGGSSTYADQLRQNFLGGVIALKVGDAYLQTLPSQRASRVSFDPATNRTFTSSDPCVPAGSTNIYLSPGSLADASAVGNGVRIYARSPGKGELWVSGTMRCTRPDGTAYQALGVIIYIVLVGDEAINDFRRQQGGGTPPPVAPPGDIARAEVSGFARMSDTGEPVPGATITLVTAQGTAIQDPAWVTRADGGFVVVVGADKNLRSGRYEILVQKLRQGPVPGRCEPVRGTPAGIGNDCDLWPVRRFYVEIARDAPQANAGVISMNFVRNIDFTNRKAVDQEFQSAPAPSGSRFR